MKKFRLSPVLRMFVFTLILTGCSPVGTTPTSPGETAAISETPVLTATPAPTETSVPTEIPTPTQTPPVPCMISFDTDRDGNWEIYVMGPDGKDPVNLSMNPAEDRNPAWSPEGNQIAFVSNRENEQGGGRFIYVMNADGSGVRQLNTNPDSDFPNWSNDGRMITYTHMDDIFSMSADGSGESVNLTNSPEKDTQSAWSPDGSQIAWLSGEDGNWNLFVMNADGSNKKQLTNDGRVYDATWTVDGQIFTHWDNPDVGCMNCVMDADGSNIKDAGGKGEIQRYLPFWTLDGHRVELAAVDMLTGDNEIYLVGEIYPDIFFNLTNNPANDRNPDWPAKCGPGTEAEIGAFDENNDSGEIVIGYAGDDPNQYQRKDNFKKACDELGIQCIYGEIPDLMDQGVDAIVHNSNNIVVKGLHQDILNARDQGIPVFLLDAEVITDGAYSITIDQDKWAKTSLEWMFEKIGGEGQFAYFDLNPATRHTDSIQNVLSQYPGINLIDFRDGMYDSNKVKPETVFFAENNPDLRAVWTNVNMTDAIHGLDESKIPQENWPLVNCDATLDGLDTWMKMKNTHPKFECIAVANPPGIAYDAVYAAYYLVTGAQIDESVLGGEYGHTLFVDAPVITDDNLQEWLKTAHDQNMQFVDEWMAPEEIRERWFAE